MKGRVRFIVAAVVCLGAVAFLVFGPLASNAVYFRTVSEALGEREVDGNSRIRVAGEVVDGSLKDGTDSGGAPGHVRFELTDGLAAVRVDFVGDPPALFKEGAPVVCEGRWSKTSNSAPEFSCDRIMIKHGSEYSPPTIATTSTSAATQANS